MTRRLIRRNQAKLDLIESADYIGRVNPATAERFLDAAKAAFFFLLENPGAGSAREYINPALVNIRVWPIQRFKKYLIFYQEIPNGIEIIRVLHGARDLKAIFKSDEFQV